MIAKHIPPTVSVLMRTKNCKEDALRAVQSLRAQDFQDYELLVTDSGSEDGTPEALSPFAKSIRKIPASEYFPARVLNELAQRAEGRILVFLNSDVALTHSGCLRDLIAPLQSKRAAATFARQVPEREAEAWVQADFARSFPKERAPEWMPYSLPFAAMTREAFEQQPFSSHCWGSEDTYWGLRAKARGLRIEYRPDCQVIHSENYTPSQFYGRKFIEGEADAFLAPRQSHFLRRFGRMARGTLRDLEAALRSGRPEEILPTLKRRAFGFLGYERGYRLGRSRQEGSSLSSREGAQVALRHHPARA